MAGGSLWTPERDAERRAFLAEGLSTSQIGARMGCSKSAVVGRNHRDPLVETKPNPIRHVAPKYGFDAVHEARGFSHSWEQIGARCNAAPQTMRRWYDAQCAQRGIKPAGEWLRPGGQPKPINYALVHARRGENAGYQRIAKDLGVDHTRLKAGYSIWCERNGIVPAGRIAPAPKPAPVVQFQPPRAAPVAQPLPDRATGGVLYDAEFPRGCCNFPLRKTGIHWFFCGNARGGRIYCDAHAAAVSGRRVAA